MPRFRGAGSSRAGGKQHVNEDDDGGKYGRYTAEQVTILEYLFQECTKPSLSERRDMISKYSALATLDSRQIKSWFKTRRSRDKWRKVSSEIQTVNKELMGANKLLAQENARLEKVVRRLVSENQSMRHPEENAPALASGTNMDSAVNSDQLILEASTTKTRLLLLAERTLTEFLSKATGSDVDWVQIPGMKSGSDSVQFTSILPNCNGAAARACCHVPLDPVEVMEILRDQSPRFRDCRKMDIFASFPSYRKGIIELIYMQEYAVTTLTPARDFWILRYTVTLEDGSLVVCQRSTSGSGAVPSSPAKPEFQRTKMLASGCLIQPCERGGSIVSIVDHVELETPPFTEALKPIYVSSKLLAQRTTVAALHHILQVAEERSSELTQDLGPFKQSDVLRSFSHRLSRGFNDAINGLAEDGWFVMNHDPAENLIVSINTTNNCSKNLNGSNTVASCGGILCIKASLLLQNVSLILLIKFLKDHRLEWWKFKVDALSAESFNYCSLAFPGLNTHLSEDSVQLGKARREDEILEVIRLKSQTPHEHLALPQRDIYLLQSSSGIGEFTIGACSELVFAPIDEDPSDDCLLLSSGFRILSLDSNTGMINAQALQTTNVASGSAEPSPSSSGSCSLLIVAFQFPFESHQLAYVNNMAQKFISHVLSFVRNFGNTVPPSGSNPPVAPVLTPSSHSIGNLATNICRSYSLKFGEELLRLGSLSGEAMLEHLWYHEDAIFCWSFKLQSVPVCLFANQAAYNMLGASQVRLLEMKPDLILGESLKTGVRTVMRQGYAILSGGTCMSPKGKNVKYDRAVIWKVQEGAGAPNHIAFAFSNCSQLTNTKS